MRSLKIFFACALGAFIGTIVSLEVNKYFWWIGLLAGTFVGYFAYQFKSVIAGASEAWKKTIAYEPNWKEIGFVCNYLLSLVCILICLILNIYIILKLSLIFKEIFIIQIFCTCYFFIFSTATGLLMNPDSNKLRNELILSTLPIAQKMWRFVILLSPPAMLTFWPMFYICHVLYAMVMTIYWFIRFLIALPELTCRLAVFLNKTVWPVIAAFVKTFFLLIHSDIRLLCGIDAAIGVYIGHSYGNALIGALAGGTFGVLNYLIVSKMILKIPETALQKT